MKQTILLLSFLSIAQLILGQEKPNNQLNTPPRYHIFRELENYTYLKNDSVYSTYEKDFFDPIKFIPLNQSKSSYLTIGGELRAKYELFRNTNWGQATDDKNGFYSQRLALHTNLVLGSYFRVYGELVSGIQTKESNRPKIGEDDIIDLFQLFTEIKLPVAKNQQIALKIGRQEMPFGSSRLVGIREGFNVRRSFDAGKISYTFPDWKVEGFYAKEVFTLPDAFNNKSNNSPDFWGTYVTNYNSFGKKGNTEFYYFGYDRKNARFEEGTAHEKRHTIGIRRFNNFNERMRYNTEINYQFGNFGNGNISAFSIEADYHYKLK